MPVSPEARRRVRANLDAGRLPLDRPQKMHAGRGDGTGCDGCGEIIDRTEVEYEATYENGRACRLHLACAALWEVERRCHSQPEASDAPIARATRENARVIRAKAQETVEENGQLRDRADVLFREAEAVIEESHRVRRGLL